MFKFVKQLTRIANALEEQVVQQSKLEKMYMENLGISRQHLEIYKLDMYYRSKQSNITSE